MPKAKALGESQLLQYKRAPHATKSNTSVAIQGDVSKSIMRTRSQSNLIDSSRLHLYWRQPEPAELRCAALSSVSAVEGGVSTHLMMPRSNMLTRGSRTREQAANCPSR